MTLHIVICNLNTTLNDSMETMTKCSGVISNAYLPIDAHKLKSIYIVVFLAIS